MQELSWSIIQNIPSLVFKKDEEIIGTPNHPSWIMFARQLANDNKHIRVLTYINSKIIHL